MPTRLSLALLALALALAASTAGVPAPAAAQMVPRMVSYARSSTTVEPCAGDVGSSLSTRRTIRYEAHSWSETTSTFAGSDCAREATLFTVAIGGTYDATRPSPWSIDYRTITPTRIGTAYLQQQCGQFAWTAGVVQNVPADACGSIALLAR